MAKNYWKKKRINYKYEDLEMNEVDLRKARAEVSETGEQTPKSLEILRKKLAATEGLTPCYDEDVLLAFLRVSKFDISKAYQRMLKYYEEKLHTQQVFGDYTPRSVKIVENARKIYACPYRGYDNSGVFIIKRYRYDPELIPYNFILRMVCLVGELIARHPLNQLCGITVVLDLSGNVSSWSEYSPSRLKLLAKLVQKVFPVRLKAVYVLNAPAVYYILYSIIYPFLSAKLRNRIILPKSMEAFHSSISPENLPKEYGGYLEEYELIDFSKKLYDKEDLFERISKYGYFTKK